MSGDAEDDCLFEGQPRDVLAVYCEQVHADLDSALRRVRMVQTNGVCPHV